MWHTRPYIPTYTLSTAPRFPLLDMYPAIVFPDCLVWPPMLFRFRFFRHFYIFIPVKPFNIFWCGDCSGGDFPRGDFFLFLRLYSIYQVSRYTDCCILRGLRIICTYLQVLMNHLHFKLFFFFAILLVGNRNCFVGAISPQKVIFLFLRLRSSIASGLFAVHVRHKFIKKLFCCDFCYQVCDHYY